MPDQLHIVPRPHEEKSPYELREQFRQENTERIHSQLIPYFEEIPFGFLVDPHDMSDHIISDDGSCSLANCDDFPEIPSALLVEISNLAKESMLFDTVEIPGGVEHDGPPMKPLISMTDEEVCDYVMDAIERSKR